MVAESGDANTPIASQSASGSDANKWNEIRQMLRKEPFRVHFFQAVRLLQLLDKGRSPVGHFVAPNSETIRFTTLTSLSFPASELYELERIETGQMRMRVQFMGLCAAISVLPTVYSEFLLARMYRRDHASEEFFDMFNHRMISFFYRGWEKYRFFVQHEKTGKEHAGDALQSSGRDKLSLRVLDLLGLGTAGLQGRGGVPDDAYLNYAGLLARHVRSADGLRRILEDYFDIGVRIEQFVGAWRKLDPADRTSLTGRGGPSERLGVGVVAGTEVWDHHGRIRATLGPMSFSRYLSFLPGREAYRELAALLRFYANGAYETEVRLVLLREEVPQCGLGAKGEDRPQLGLVSWLKTKPIARDPADAIYLIQ